jgi:hypothetical protein
MCLVVDCLLDRCGEGGLGGGIAENVEGRGCNVMCQEGDAGGGNLLGELVSSLSIKHWRRSGL